MMKKMGYKEGKGLGKGEQGRLEPIPQEGNNGRQGLGFFLGAVGGSIPIPWLTEEAVWVPQWPLSSEKLEAATKLISEQLRLGHLEPSTSPWNTLIFIIKKKSGKWHLLHDLRAINAQMRLFGSVQ